MDTTAVGRAPRRRIHICLVTLGLLAAAVAPLQGQQGEPLRVGGDVSAPRKISGDEPSYTEVARRVRATGTVIIEAVIDEHGAVTDTRILKPLPFGLDGKAIEAVKTWKFIPAMFQGKPVRVYYILTVNFHLTTDFDSGPAFDMFMGDHPDLRALVEEGDYVRAGAEIDDMLAKRPDDNSLRFGRAYMHLGAGEMKEAWRVAQSVGGPEQAEIAQSIAAKAAEQLREHPGATDAERTEMLEVGLPAATLAAKLITLDDPEGLADALRTKAELLRAQAELVRDAARRQGILDDAKALEDRADKVHPLRSNLE